MTNSSETPPWANFIGPLQDMLSQSQQSWAKHAESWAGLWPPGPAAQANLGAVPSLLAAFNQLMSMANQAQQDGAKSSPFELLNSVFTPLMSQALQATQPMQKYWENLVAGQADGAGLGFATAGFPGFGGIPGGEIPGGDVAPLGAAREYTRQLQAYAVESAELPSKLAAYQQVMAKFPQLLQKRLEEHSAKLAQSGTKLESARAVFDFWVDAAEEAFAELAHAPEYGRAQGELSNLLMELKIARQQMLDQAIEVIGLPSRRELDTTHRRMAALRRENRALRRELSAIKKDINELMAESRKASNTKPVAAAAKAPPPVKASAKTSATKTVRKARTKASAQVNQGE